MAEADTVRRVRRRDYRPIKVEGDVAYIALTKGLVAVIDAADVPLVGRQNWQVVSKNGLHYAGRMHTVAPGIVRRVILHRLLLGVDSPDIGIDHIDRDTMNCRRSNLRIASQGVNLQNASKRGGCSTPYKGVCLFLRLGRRRHFHAYIGFEGRTISLGSHLTAEEAAQAYDVAAVSLYGPNAYTNF